MLQHISTKAARFGCQDAPCAAIALFAYMLLHIAISSVIAFLPMLGYYIAMTTREQTDKHSWDETLIQRPEASFLHSFDWGQFQTQMGKRALRLVLTDQGQDVFIQGFHHSLPLKRTYLYIPRAPRLSPHQQEELSTFAKKQGYDFIRIEPKEKVLYPNTTFVAERQPQDTLMLDLTDSVETLLANMHSKTRYNIRLAEKKGVDVKREKHAEVFLSLHAQTTARDGFHGHSDAYYRAMIALPIVEQFTAYYNGVAIASNLCVIFGDTITYLHGTSGNDHREVMAPYLLQWIAMQYGKAQGCSLYDFWGVAPSAKKEDADSQTFHAYTWPSAHRFSGITRFKAGFGGQPVSYGQAQDIVIQPLPYFVYHGVRMLKTFIRR